MRVPYRICDWIGRLTGTIIMTPHPSAVGNCAEQIHYGLLQARREGKKLVILFPYELPWPLQLRLPDINLELGRIESEYRVELSPTLEALGRALITVYYAPFRAVSVVLRKLSGRSLEDVHTIPMMGVITLWQPNEHMAGFSWEVVRKFDWKGHLEAPLGISLKKEKKAISEKFRARVGLPEGAWFVCLHVRDGGYHNDHHAAERNANILNYVGAIEEITSRGGWVVRMGDARMTRLPSMARVIDYPFTEVKGPLMDLYLISECRAYIGMQAGIADVALLFERPFIMTNMANWLFGFPAKKGDVGLFKHVYSKSRGRFLSIREWLSEPFDAVSFIGLGQDYVLQENTPEELRAVVREFFDRSDAWELTPLQRRFNEQRAQSGKKLISQPIVPGGEGAVYFRPDVRAYDLIQRYRIAARLESEAGTLGAEFLSNNWERSAMLSEPLTAEGIRSKDAGVALSGAPGN